VCRRCLPLSRRSFASGLLAAACFPGPPDALVEPAISLRVPEGAPRTVALTLDACSGLVDMRIVTALIDLSVPATIFATGLWLRGNAPVLALMRTRADLFTLQNHGELHLPDLVEAARGEPPRWYRGAAGLYSPPAVEAIQAMGCLIAGYSLNADAGASLPAASVARRIAAASSGDVIVAHINQPHRPSGAGVASGIAALKQAGAVFVGLDALPSTPPECRSHSV
jgi:peptidoglycan/xylan/chitin deacetylase (PgdA/CDA1 family)